MDACPCASSPGWRRCHLGTGWLQGWHCHCITSHSQGAPRACDSGHLSVAPREGNCQGEIRERCISPLSSALRELFNQKWTSCWKAGKINATFSLLCMGFWGGRCYRNTPPLGDHAFFSQEIAWINKRTQGIMLFQAREGREISLPFSSLSHCHQQENCISSEHGLAPPGFKQNGYWRKNLMWIVARDTANPPLSAMPE